MSVKCDEVPGYTAAFGQGTMSCLDTCQEHQRKVNAKAPLEAQEACNKDAKCGGLYDKGTLAPRGNWKKGWEMWDGGRQLPGEGCILPA